MSRSSWGLSTPTDDWRDDARCAADDVDPEWWSAPDGRAVHYCLRHCPVLAQCRADVRHNPHYVKGTIHHGVFYAGTIDEPKPATYQPVEIACTQCMPSRIPAAARLNALVCIGCGETFYAPHKNARYCDETCQKAAEYRRRKAKV